MNKLGKGNIVSAQIEDDIYKACKILKYHNLHRLVVYDSKQQILATINNRKIFIYIIKNLDLEDTIAMNSPWEDLVNISRSKKFIILHKEQPLFKAFAMM